jgi:hypothetical protein
MSKNIIFVLMYHRNKLLDLNLLSETFVFVKNVYEILEK